MKSHNSIETNNLEKQIGKLFMKKFFLFGTTAFLAINVLASLLLAQQKPQTSVARELDFDEAGEEETLNRELWEKVKGNSYENALEHVERVQRSRRKNLKDVMTLPNGWQIKPAGQQIEVGRLPFEAVAFAGQIVVLNTGYYSKEPQEISVVNPKTNALVKTLRLPGLFPSATVGLDKNLYVSGGISQKVFRYNEDFDPPREYAVNGYVAGITAVDGEHVAVLYLVTAANADDFQKGNYQAGKIAVLNTTSGAVEREAEVGYFPQTIRYLNNKFYVTVSGENKLRVFDRQLKLLANLPTGQLPQNLCTDSANRLFVVNSNSDDITVFNSQTDRLTATVSMSWGKINYGSAPTSCAVENNRLFVTQANANDVAVFDLTLNRLLGYIPTAWYPTKVFFENRQMFVASAKGVRPFRPNVDGPQAVAEKGGSQYVLTLLKGSLAVVSQNQINANLGVWTSQVKNSSPLINPSANLNLPIKHIFYIVRENRTYDQVLGDLPRGNGDRYLTLFGRNITPVAHRLAEDFVTLDSYYADGEISVLGHSFTTSGYASPFLEWLGNNAYSGRYSGYPFGMVPAVTSPAYLWDALDAKKIDYRIYGENYFLYTRAFRILMETFGADAEISRKFYAQMMNYAGRVDRGNIFYQFAKSFYGQANTPAAAERLLLENQAFKSSFSKFLCGDESLVKFLDENRDLRRRFAEYLAHYPSNYRSWDLNFSDLERAAAWKTDFERQLQTNNVAQLNYLWLPNDHTGGTDKRYLPPDQLVAQNDAALGLIVETISHSAIWKNSLILVTEDDAQNGPDHVDATRTIALAVSPYVKRNAVVSNRYDQLSLLRTIENLLGLPPLNLNDALAVPMFGVFAAKPDFTQFTVAQPPANLSENDRLLYQNIKATIKK